MTYADGAGELTAKLLKLGKSEYARLAGRDRRYIKGQKYTLSLAVRQILLIFQLCVLISLSQRHQIHTKHFQRVTSCPILSARHAADIGLGDGWLVPAPLHHMATNSAHSSHCPACRNLSPSRAGTHRLRVRFLVYQPPRRWWPRITAQAGADPPRSRLDPDDR